MRIAGRNSIPTEKKKRTNERASYEIKKKKEQAVEEIESRHESNRDPITKLIRRQENSCTSFICNQVTYKEDKELYIENY